MNTYHRVKTIIPLVWTISGALRPAREYRVRTAVKIAMSGHWITNVFSYVIIAVPSTVVR